MKNLSLLNVLLMALAIFALSSCGEDDPADSALPPSVRLLDDAGFLSIDSEVAAGTAFSVRLQADKGDNTLKSLVIQRDGADIDAIADDLTIVGISLANNPQAITGADVDGFTWDITLLAHTDLADVPYDFIVQDDGGNSGTATIWINTANTNPLSVAVVDGPTSFMASANSLQVIKIDAIPGAANLRDIAVFEDGVPIDPTRLRLHGVEFDNNPMTLTGDDVNGLDNAEITIRVADAGAPTYRIEVTDEDDVTASAEVFINIGTELDPGAEVTAILFYNNDGPNQGGVDLEDGTSISSLNADADIIDAGIDTDLPVADNWLKQIQPANGATLRLPDSAQAELFDYDNINTREAVIAAYDSGIAASITDALTIGDVFMVKQANDHFIIVVREINTTDNDNLDNYVIDIKRVLD